MLIGRNNIIAHPRCGISESHLKAISNVSKEHHVVIGMRSVSPLAKHWIEKGYPTKSFVIKNKTGRMGPCQGLIAIDPNMGRTSEPPSRAVTPSSSQDEYDVAQQTGLSVKELREKYAEQLNYALAHDDTLKAIPLVLSWTDLETLQAVTILPKADSEGDYQLMWYDESAQVRSAQAHYDAGTGQYKILDAEGEPITVLGKRIINTQGEHEALPVTADYDLLVVCPTFEDFDPGLEGKDHTPLRTQSLNSDAFKRALNKGIGRPESPQEDLKGGNWSYRTKGVVNAINHEIAVVDEDKRPDKTEGLEMVHHNAEFSNPFASALGSSLPATIFLPESMDLSPLSKVPDTVDDCVFVETPEELNQLRDYLGQKGYYWPANVNLNAEVPVFPEEKVAAVRALIDKQLSQKNVLQTKQKEANSQQSEDDSTPSSDPSLPHQH